jgi:hypothetical protein
LELIVLCLRLSRKKEGPTLRKEDRLEVRIEGKTGVKKRETKRKRRNKKGSHEQVNEINEASCHGI